MTRLLATLTLLAACTTANLACRSGGAPAAGVGTTQAQSTAPERLAAHVLYLSQLDPPRSSRHPAALMKAAEYIAACFESAGARVAVQDFEVDGEIYRNVIAFHGPETPDRIVVGAHYDVCGELPGADDNGSGVAGLLELSARLTAAQLETQVELVAYSLEEPPYFGGEEMGSAQHAAQLREQGVLVRGMLCLEMIGYFSDEPGSQSFPVEGMDALYPTTGNYIAVVGRTKDQALITLVHEAMNGASNLPVEMLAAPAAVPGVSLSDHRNYWDAGYTAVMLTDTANYRNTHYHTAGDTADRLDYERMAEVVAGTFAAVIELGKR